MSPAGGELEEAVDADATTSQEQQHRYDDDWLQQQAKAEIVLADIQEPYVLDRAHSLSLSREDLT